MLPQLIYLLVILIWATTPLAIKLGGESFSPLAALCLRIALAFFVGCAIFTISGFAGLNIRRHSKLYFAASISVFPNMALVYWAATYISSGLIALLFGLSPFFSAILSRLILKEDSLQPRKLLAIVIAVLGLMLVFIDRSQLNVDSNIGIILMLVSNVIFSGSAIWVKKINQKLAVPPIEQALGSMAFALPGLFTTWYLIVGVEPVEVSDVSIAAIIYLAFMGSLLGLVGYYYILNRFTVETVALIPLITPVLAIFLGVVVADETLSLGMIVGAGLIIIALAIHQQLWRLATDIIRCRR